MPVIKGYLNQLIKNICSSVWDNEIDIEVNRRELLINIMTKVGFVNYPLEWWHWSYGDRYWAAVNKTESIYGAEGLKKE